MIVECQVTRVVREKRAREGDARIEKIEADYIRTLSLCHSGKNLYQDGHPIYEQGDSTKGLDPLILNQYLIRHRKLAESNPRILCAIEKDRYIYDRDMPHLSYEVQGVKPGDRLAGMIVETRPGLLLLTLQNSKITNCKQHPLDLRDVEDPKQRERKAFHKLGLCAEKVGPKNGGKFYSLERMINASGVN